MKEKTFLLETNISQEISLITDDEDDSEEIEYEAELLSKSPLENTEDIRGADIDEFLRLGGECGRYQFFLQLFLSLALLPSVYPVLIYYYIGFDPPWKCKQPLNISHVSHFQNNITSNISIYNSVLTNFSSSSHCHTSVTYRHDNDLRCRLSRSQWSYDYHKKTLVTDFDLVCDRNWMDATFGSIIFVGWGIGIVVTGYLSDKFGRKKIMFPCQFLMLVFFFLHAFASQMWHLIAARFLTGFFFSSPALNGYVLLMELVGPTKRSLSTTVNSFLLPLGALFLTLKAKFVDDWRTLVIICSAPYMVLMVFAFCIPESVRWLNLQGRNKEAEDILRKAARINKRTLPALYLKHAESHNKHGKKASYIDLFTRWKLLKIVFSQAFIWFSAGLTFYALSWAFADLGGDMYLNFMLSFSVELPASFVALYFMERIGRRKTTISSFLLTSIFCAVVACIPVSDHIKVLRMIFGLTGKFTMSVAGIMVYMWCSEIYATVLRSQGMGINIVASRAGAAASPFIKILNNIHPSAPFGVMAILCLISAIMCYLLPETLNKSTRETLDDMLHDVEPLHEMRTLTSLDTSHMGNNNSETKQKHLVKQDNDYEDNDDDDDEEEHDENAPLLVPSVHMLPSDHV